MDWQVITLDSLGQALHVDYILLNAKRNEYDFIFCHEATFVRIKTIQIKKCVPFHLLKLILLYDFFISPLCSKISRI